MAGFTNQTTRVDYAEQLTALVDDHGPGGTVLVAGASILYQLAVLNPPAWTQDILATPGSLILSPGTSGFRAKDAVANTHATVSCYLAGKNEPLAQVSATSNATVTSNVMTGIIAANGTITAGTGFTVAKGGAGSYTVTFTTAFAAAPVVVASVLNNALTIGVVAAPTTTGFGITINTLGGAGSDQPWNFIAQAVV